MEIIIRYIYADEISDIILSLSFPNIVSNRNQRVFPIQTIGERLEKLSFLIIEKLLELFEKNVTNLHYAAPIFYSIIHNKKKIFQTIFPAIFSLLTLNIFPENLNLQGDTSARVYSDQN